MENNTLQFVRETMRSLSAAGVRSWLFGGWAEELHGLSAPRLHHDLDLLYPAEDFHRLDMFIRTGVKMGEIAEIASKRFGHKRAYERNGVMVEVLLLRPTPEGYVTDFFSRHRFSWPNGTLDDITGNPGLPIASAAALRLYREQHTFIQKAFAHHHTQP
jgi:hypothetical protein